MTAKRRKIDDYAARRMLGGKIVNGLSAKGIALIEAQVSLIRWPGGSQDVAITGWEIEKEGAASVVTPAELAAMS